MRSSTTPPVSSHSSVYCALPGPIRSRELVRTESRNARRPAQSPTPCPGGTRRRRRPARAPPCARRRRRLRRTRAASTSRRSRRTWRRAPRGGRGAGTGGGAASVTPPHRIAQEGLPPRRAIRPRRTARSRRPGPGRFTGSPPPRERTVTTLVLNSADITTMAADVLVVATAPAGGRKKGAVLAGPAAGLKAAPTRKLEEALAALGATGKAGDVVRVPGAGIAAAPVVVAVGLGAGPWTDEALRRAAGNAIRSLAGSRRAVLALPVESAVGARRRRAGRAARRLLVRLLPRRQQGRAEVPGRPHHPAGADAKDADTVAAVTRAKAIAGAVNFARDLVNTPAGDLPPAALVDAAADAVVRPSGRGRGPRRGRSSEAAGFGGILGVGKGSANPPRLVRLAYRPEGATAHLALVGKGITFDTGGISIKPSLNMHEMKGDMGGAAAVVGRDARDREARPPRQRDRLPVPRGEHAERPRTAPRRRAPRLRRQDRRGHRHRRRGPPRALPTASSAPRRTSPTSSSTSRRSPAPRSSRSASRTFGIMANDDDLREAMHDASDARGRADLADAAARRSCAPTSTARSPTSRTSRSSGARTAA